MQVQGETALHAASENNRVSCVKFLIESGATVNKRDVCVVHNKNLWLLRATFVCGRWKDTRRLCLQPKKETNCVWKS